MQEIFDALQNNIVSVPQFRDEVLMRNNFKEQLPMDVLFGDYGFLKLKNSLIHSKFLKLYVL